MARPGEREDRSPSTGRLEISSIAGIDPLFYLRVVNQRSHGNEKHCGDAHKRRRSEIVRDKVRVETGSPMLVNQTS